jgi:enterobactin synthetase component D
MIGVSRPTQPVTVQNLREALGLPAYVAVFESGLEQLEQYPEAQRELPATLARAVPKRRREFLAGRYCATRALHLAGCTAPGELDIGTDRLPCWPAGWLGCISHTAHVAVAMAAACNACVALGIDVEKWMSAQVANDVQRQIASPDELALLHDQPLQQALTLLFSAKETLYKTLYPLTRRFRDFSAARLVAVAPGQLDLVLSESWGEEWPRDTSFAIRHVQRTDDVVTALCLP